MEIGNLIRMANSIGDFFDAMPDRKEALAGIATHIQKSWEPRMRVALLSFLDAHPDGIEGDVRLSPTLLEAVTANREKLRPRVAAT
jgi:formate dehydrogenase subunit delta